ncbi:hypothetical protein H4R33_003289 [Dimargaris cristalligena]|uniref:Zinc-finger of the MIZ type in Nse subunit-domain-containing protein n=1 Tax=Dimargaris cristalligena TaxID=215637 RepID=A0A4P9ZT84_9FUNG|nr:hypothetical protein H4R33_003289 [Dimargaris cristalligena]RKP36665.1 zinc-finger of the MIZ type in Nse subunit-domain-containing protein [Dimargaris cristalligena]|eukprot:RKP36665.1 zinc-finger of the MIZ type in Nse subunit-domain-containing protein [Dimargaris cristalligena]
MSRSSQLSGSVPVASKLSQLVLSTEDMQDKILRAIAACTDAAIDLEEAEEDAQVQELEATMRSFIDLQARLVIEKSTLADLRNQILSEGHAAEANWVEYYESMNAKEWSKWSNEYSDGDKYGRNDAYREFRERLWEVNHDEPMPALFEDASDDELIMNTQVVSLNCPLTCQLFEEPVKSTVCKHSFSKHAIMDYIRQSSSPTPCPVSGCSRSISLADLKPDRILERKVARHQIGRTDRDNDNEYEAFDEA